MFVSSIYSADLFGTKEKEGGIDLYIHRVQEVNIRSYSPYCVKLAWIAVYTQH